MNWFELGFIFIGVLFAITLLFAMYAAPKIKKFKTNKKVFEYVIFGLLYGMVFYSVPWILIYLVKFLK